MPVCQYPYPIPTHLLETSDVRYLKSDHRQAADWGIENDILVTPLRVGQYVQLVVVPLNTALLAAGVVMQSAASSALRFCRPSLFSSLFYPFLSHFASFICSL